MEHNLSRLLTHTERVAHEAGSILKRGTGLRQINFQDAKDVKLAADVESERFCRAALAEFSDYPIVGEEEGGDESLPSSDKRYWVVDPLDGTINYLRETGLCCVSIGLMEGNRPLLGVIHDFNTEETFTGGAGLGFFRNGEAVTPSWAENIEGAILATGFPSSGDYATESLRELIGQIQRFKKVRMIGSAALAVAFVAMGRFDVYREEGCRWWDIAAGIALAEGAGAAWRVTPLSGAPFQVSVSVAGRGAWL